MDDGFGGVVRISNVSDYIAPSQACVIPLRTNTVDEQQELVAVRNRKDGSGDGKQSDKKVGVKVSISLADCLACSGCITSAETVLVEEQSITRVFEALADRKYSLHVVSVSSASLASLSAARKASPQAMARLLTRFFVGKGADVVIDTNIGLQLSLEESWRELQERLSPGVEEKKPSPLLVSACPGFVCYAEKSHSGLLVPLLSRAKSCQSALGVVVKEWLPTVLSLPSSSTVYHASVMPCFDRKLEASRAENRVAGSEEERHVDCVLSTAEILSALDEFDGDHASEAESLTDLPPLFERLPQCLQSFMNGDVFGMPGNVSGGYLEYAERRWKEEMEQRGYSATSSAETKKVSSNLESVTVRTDNGEHELRMARLYGFRNIQNLVRKLKSGKQVADYDFVEVMACPSGCANGGGQVRGANTAERASLTAAVEELHHSLPLQPPPSTSFPIDPSRLQAHFRPVEPGAMATSLAW